MKTNYIHIETIPELFGFFHLKKPSNPLVAIINPKEIKRTQPTFEKRYYTLGFFSITLKGNSPGVFFKKQNFNFNHGILSFTKPNQNLSIVNTDSFNDNDGWILVFHNDLLKNSPLHDKITSYRFFSHDIHEGLVLSDKEQMSITNCINFVKNEINEESDDHTHIVISSVLEVLLNICNRVYERQFKEKALPNNHIIAKVDAFLKFYYDNNLFAEKGIPSVQQIAKYVKLSPNYLSTILKKESGKNTKDYINCFILEKSKNLLINKQEYSINELSYKLGFNYPHYFSRFFKSKIGKTPQQYRKEKSF